MIELPAQLRRFITGLFAGALGFTTATSSDRTFAVAAEARVWVVTE